MLAQHPIIANDGRVTRLRRLDATLVDAAAKRPKGLEAGDRSIAGVDRGEMHKGSVSQFQGQIAHPSWRFRMQFLKPLLDQALILLHLFGLSSVAHHRPFHWASSL